MTETTRIAGLRHVVIHARAARQQLTLGRIGPAVYEWGAARHHHGLIVGMLETSRQTFAACLLRKILFALGSRLERAVEPQARAYGWNVAEPIVEALAPLASEYDVRQDEVTDVAARAAADIVRRFDVRERP